MTLPLSRSRASSLKHGASGIEVEVILRTLMTHVTAYGANENEDTACRAFVFLMSLHSQNVFDNKYPGACSSIASLVYCYLIIVL